MARLNWKKKYEELVEYYGHVCKELDSYTRTIPTLKGQLTRVKKKLDTQTMYQELVDAARKLHDEDVKKLAESIPADVHKKTVAELRKEISKMQKEITKSAEARELVELLAKTKGYASIEFNHYETEWTISIPVVRKYIRNASLLLALRVAKKEVEVENDNKES